MTQWNRTIGRQVTNALPTWYGTLSAPSGSTLFAKTVGESPGSVLPGRIVWPGGFDPIGTSALEYSGSDGNAWYGAVGYGGAVYVPELGVYGTMVLGITGEHCITEQMNSFGISEDNPSWNFFQQPLYATSLAEANTYNADAYFNLTDYSTQVSAGRYITYGTGPSGEDVVNWNGTTFPFGFGNGWVMRRKYGAGGGSTLLGNNRPHWFRYGMPCYIPPSMTGTSAGAILTNSSGTIYGPYNSGPTLPASSPMGGFPDDNWYSEVWGSGVSAERKHWLHAMNVQTRAWQRLAPVVPQAFGRNYSLSNPQSSVDVERKRVYYTSQAQTASGWGYYWADFSGGLAGMTWGSSIINATLVSGDTQVYYHGQLVIPRTGANAGKRLYFMQGTDSTLVLLDMGASDGTGASVRKLSLSGMPSTYWRFGWDDVNELLYVIHAEKGAAITGVRFSIPTNYTNAASYSVQPLTINMGGVSGGVVEGGGYTLSEYGRHSQVIPVGGGVIFVPQRFGPMIAFRVS